MICRREQLPNSFLRADRCEPRYIRNLRSQFIKTHGLTPVSFEREIEIAAKKEQEAAKEHMKELIRSNEELKEAFLKLNHLVLEWKELKQSRR